MTFIKKIPWRTILVIILCALFFLPIGAKIGHKYSWLSTEKTLNNKTISNAINKSTNENNTSIKLEGNKFKHNDSLNIVLTQKPTSTQEVVYKLDSCVIGKKEYSKLTKSQKNRLGKWIKK
ncbi:hypothetical protein [Thalassobellus citreus]|uniref:hypothetical protein n=1 Tax=Thalassobellus citreus TaxID=3367752 RepID=UPI00379E3707